MNSSSDQGRHKSNAKPTQHKPIFESRAVYTASGSKIGKCQGSSLNLIQAQPAPKQPNFKSSSDAGGIKFNGKLTKAEPIFESRAVYTSAILLAGGTGSRMGGGTPKQFRMLCGRLLALYSFDFFAQESSIDEIIVVADKEYRSFFQSSEKSIRFAEPGRRRQDSVYHGLIECNERTDFICIHDSARPFIEKLLFHNLLETAINHKAAALAIPATNTIKRADAQQMVLQTLERSELWEIQTPQIIERSLLMNAYDHAHQCNIEATDDLSLIESLGQSAKLVMGSPKNIKVTTPTDWLLAQILCESN